MDPRETLFRQWLDRHTGLMYKVSRTFAGSREDQEDLLQEIFYQVWVSIPSFQEQSQASTWIYKVALNTALSWQRKERGHSRWGRLAGRAAPIPEAVPDPTSVGADAEKQELLQEVYKAVYALPKVDCALALLYLNGVKYSEMAEILGMSESNVGVRLNRMRQHLAQTLGEDDDESQQA
jgi:RNA polymerase sigma-70 factor, ECF subfamily